jgi:large subunit ribosomal protein L1
VQDQKGGSVEFRVEKAGIVHAPIGKLSFSAEKLQENFTMLMEQVMRAKPSTSKGNYVLGITLSSTMGPGVKLDIGKFSSVGGKD